MKTTPLTYCISSTAYCLNNPMKHTDPSGYMTPGGSPIILNNINDAFNDHSGISHNIDGVRVSGNVYKSFSSAGTIKYEGNLGASGAGVNYYSMFDYLIEDSYRTIHTKGGYQSFFNFWEYIDFNDNGDWHKVEGTGVQWNTFELTYKIGLRTEGGAEKSEPWLTVNFNRGIPQIETNFTDKAWGAITPCPFIVYHKGGSKDKYYNTHEPGHVIQFLILGPVAYYRSVAIPSLITSKTPYHSDMPWEKSANQLWYWLTGENDPRNPLYPNKE